MKRFWLLLCILLFCVTKSVFALEYDTYKLIPVETQASVHTETFDYVDFIFHNVVDASENGSIVFSSIKNISDKKVPVSINLLLFDEKEENVGFVTYCTFRDISSDNSGFELESGKEVPFSISVTRKYFSSGKTTKDVKYVAVLNDNINCQIGGYDRYTGLKIDEIKSGRVTTEKEWYSDIISYFNKYMKDSTSRIFILIGLVGLVLLLVIGFINNSLYKRMFAKTSVLSYVLVINSFISVRLAFGSIIATVFIALYLVGIFLVLIKFYWLFLILSGFWLLAILINIIKIISGKYNLLLLEPSLKATTISDYSLDNDNEESGFSLDSMDNINLNNNSDINNNSSFIGLDDDLSNDRNVDISLDSDINNNSALSDMYSNNSSDSGTGINELNNDISSDISLDSDDSLLEEDNNNLSISEGISEVSSLNDSNNNLSLDDDSDDDNSLIDDEVGDLDTLDEETSVSTGEDTNLDSDLGSSDNSLDLDDDLESSDNFSDLDDSNDEENSGDGDDSDLTKLFQ